MDSPFTFTILPSNKESFTLIELNFVLIVGKNHKRFIVWYNLQIHVIKKGLFSREKDLKVINIFFQGVICFSLKINANYLLLLLNICCFC